MSEQPVTLPWHREAAKRCLDEVYYKWTKEDAAVVTKIIADHDPHATTLRLLREALEHIENYDDGMAQWLTESRAHLAAMKGSK